MKIIVIVVTNIG